MERGDTLSALTALGYLGDADGTPWSEQSAHGGHSDRQEWFEYGYDSQKPADCDAVFQ
jgi:predicted metalloprotease